LSAFLPENLLIICDCVSYKRGRYEQQKSAISDSAFLIWGESREDDTVGESITDFITRVLQVKKAMTN
jgi:hypothetical protein